ncbi:MAG: hypothetical protein ABSC72_12065 [Methylovirgula sp.]
MSDDLQKLISEAKNIAEARGLYMLVYLLSLAEAEVPKETKAEPVEKPKTAPHDASRRVRRLPSDR